METLLLNKFFFFRLLVGALVAKIQYVVWWMCLPATFLASANKQVAVGHSGDIITRISNITLH